MEANHGPRAACSEIAKHFPRGSVQEGGAVRLDKLLDGGIRPTVRHPNDADDLKFGSVLGLLVACRDKFKAQCKLVAFGVPLSLCNLDLALELGLGGGVTIRMGVEVDLREEVPFKLQRGGLHG
jgi:hypothetical protein